MTFPTNAATNESEQATGVTSHTVALPASIASGDLLIVTFGCSGNPTVTWPGGYTNIDSGPTASSTSRLETDYRVADGSEGASITVTTSTSQRSVHKSWRFTGAHASTPPEGTNFNTFSANPDPPNLDPAGWATEDTYWIVIQLNDAFNSPSAYPTNYSIGQNWNAPGSNFPTIAYAERTLNAASDNPGAFTLAGGNANYVAQTLAIRPAGVVAPTRRVQTVVSRHRW